MSSPRFLRKVRRAGLPGNERGKNRKCLSALSERPFGERWAPVAGCGIAGSAAVSAPARRPTWPRRPFAPAAPLPPPEPVGNPAGGRARKESGAPRPRPAPTPPAGSSRPALGDRAARFRRGSFSNMSGSLPRRARVARQRLVDYSSRPGRPPPPARHLRFGTVRNRRLRWPQPRAARCLQAAPASGSAAAAGRRGQPGSGPWKKTVLTPWLLGNPGPGTRMGNSLLQIATKRFRLPEPPLKGRVAALGWWRLRGRGGGWQRSGYSLWPELEVEARGSWRVSRLFLFYYLGLQEDRLSLVT
ncbi:uncharacterized protein AAG666_016402 [Megaptera novaeangliae]